MEKNILENISLIASAISAVTAITTSLRALGKSREDERSEVSTCCRVGDLHKVKKPVWTNSLFIHLISTVIWFVLSALFAMPLFMRKSAEGQDTGIILPALPFLLLFAVIVLIWRKALLTNK